MPMTGPEAGGTGGPASSGEEEFDPFDLPEWLGTEPVVYETTSSLDAGPTVTGVLSVASADRTAEPLRLDLVAVDACLPAPVVSAATRQRAHAAWVTGEVAFARRTSKSAPDGVFLAVPGVGLSVERVCESIRRCARAVGASTSSFSVRLRL